MINIPNNSRVCFVGDSITANNDYISYVQDYFYKNRNSDGIKLVRDIDVTGMNYDDAMQRLLLSEGLESYLADGSQITITVAGGKTRG